ncbi:IscS subfamily cysteine desulfurase [Priestia koreensis]|uniref:IscS subfamily cysteine desulfurase n=1 Tax=Priestia koreensis TaxID=284581 RepID=UPI0028F72819|nr:IscS subfamily cysteine desulfurase [Priestia koreensis]
MIYLDYASTTPMRTEAIDVYKEVATSIYGNTHSLHDVGTTAHSLVEACKEKLAELINGDKNGVFFTSGGTEANECGIRALLASAQNGKHIITTKMEHASILHTCEDLEKEGYEVTYLAVEQSGRVCLDALKSAIREDTALFIFQHVNHEMGAVQPIEEIALLAEEHGIFVHCDVVQSFGKLPIDLKRWRVHSLSASSHKIYGPKGCGLLYLHPSISVYTQKGTLDTPSIAAFTTASELAYKEMDNTRIEHTQLREQLHTLLASHHLPVTVEGDDEVLPSIVGISVHWLQGQYIMLQCNRYNIAISTGSACQVGHQHPSYSMLALGKTADEAKQFVRVSFGRHTTKEHIEAFVNVLTRTCAELCDPYEKTLSPKTV